MNQVSSNETHISAQQNQARTHSRFSCPHGHKSRAPHSQAAPRKGPRAVDAVKSPATVTTTSNTPGLTNSESNRFRETNRLLSAAAFERVFEQASRSRDKLFTVLCRCNDAGVARLGLAISRKYCRRATARNRIKRAIRESFRQHQALLAGLDIVVINHAAAASADHPIMAQSLNRHWRRCTQARHHDEMKTTDAGTQTDG